MISIPDINKYWQDNWTETPIQYEGADFRLPANSEWVAIEVIPYDRQVIGYAGKDTRKADFGIVRVRCYSTSPTMAVDLAVKATTFFECIAIGTMNVHVGVPDGNGTISLDNGIFEFTLEFQVEDYN